MLASLLGFPVEDAVTDLSSARNAASFVTCILQLFYSGQRHAPRGMREITCQQRDPFDPGHCGRPIRMPSAGASGTGCRRSNVRPEFHASLLVSSPIFSIQIFTTSPFLRNSPRPAPTPAGVPVRMTSPG